MARIKEVIMKSEDLYDLAVAIVTERDNGDTLLERWRSLSDFDRELLFFSVIGIAVANRRCLDGREEL